ncbi:cysteine hydrolase family protein [Pseudoxanthomonas sp. z9]|uniref:cysteine hydrolase family protein n=1 Tax=Pseudoxanthomonas sp. z9 TaxID=2584942 RepID=UPI0011420251|nr:cysteine hydrolase family protein [Pseudoxanthomonas sp. z9]
MSSPRRALIVIDVQNEYFTGGLPIEHPPVSESLPNLLRAMDAAQARGIPVIVVQHSAPAGAPVFVPGTATWKLHPDVAGRPRDHYIEKSLASAFTGTDLADWLAARGIDTLAVVGYMTHNCDASTIYEGAHRGLRMEFLHDATGALPCANAAGSASAEEIHRVFSVVFHSNFAAVASTEAWITALDAQAPLPIDNVPQSNQRAREAVA